MIVLLLVIAGLLILDFRASAFEVKTKGQIEDFIEYQANRQGVPIKLALGIARCESGLNPMAKNQSSSASSIYQFLRGTWKETTRRLGWESGQDVFDAKLNIVAGIYLLKEDGVRHWFSSKECWS